MKLIFCTKCQDIVKLKKTYATCQCGKSYGYYKKDGLNAVIGGSCIPVGFANDSFTSALEHQPREGMGLRFIAFVIPMLCPTIDNENYSQDI